MRLVDGGTAVGVAPPAVVTWAGLFAAGSGAAFDGTAIEWLHAVLPAWTSYLFAAATLLGEAWVFVPVLAAAYWFGDPDRVAPAFGLIFGGLALAVVLKSALALPRPATGPMIPPEAAEESLREAYAWTIRADGYGFPSAHALGAVLTWGSLAGASRAGSRPARLAVATALALLVATSRVALGVHYAVDVVGGLAIGVALLVGWRGAVRRVQRPATATLVAGALAAALPVVLGVGGDSPLYALGAILGALGTWLAVGPSGRRFAVGLVGAGTAAVGLVVVFGGGIVVGSVVPGPVGSVATTATMAAAIFSWPTAVQGVRGRVDAVGSRG